MMRLLTLCLLVALASSALGRRVPLRNWNYDSLSKEADLIVIARSIGVKETDYQEPLPGIYKGAS